MESKDYVNYFSEIKDLSEVEQERLLEKARGQAVTTQERIGVVSMNLLLCFVTGFVVGMILSFPLVGDFEDAIIPISVGAAMIVSSLHYKHSKVQQLRKGLLSVLAAEKP